MSSLFFFSFFVLCLWHAHVTAVSLHVPRVLFPSPSPSPSSSSSSSSFSSSSFSSSLSLPPLSLPRLIFGTLHFSPRTLPLDAASTLLSSAIYEHGISAIDLSDVYGAERFENAKYVAQVLRELNVQREEVQLIGKMDCSSDGYDTSADHLNDVLNTYLDIFNTTYVDLVLLHRQDYLMNASEVIDVFSSWSRSGSVLYFGTSNFDSSSFMQIHDEFPLVTNEVEASVWSPESLCPVGSGNISGSAYFTNSGSVPFHWALKRMPVLAWGPLGGDPYGGMNRLFGSWSSPNPRRSELLSVLSSVGSELGVSSDVVALAWLLRHPSSMLPILGTTNATRLSTQVTALNVAKDMQRAQWYRIAKVAGMPTP